MSNTEEQMLAAGFKRPVEMEPTEEQKQELKLRFEELMNQKSRIMPAGTEARIIPPSLNLTDESLNAVRAIVREEVALLKQELVKDVLKSLAYEL